LVVPVQLVLLTLLQLLMVVLRFFVVVLEEAEPLLAQIQTELAVQ
jgi:hypothetical protein